MTCGEDCARNDDRKFDREVHVSCSRVFALDGIMKCVESLGISGGRVASENCTIM